jgi:chromosome segregation ATPase
MSPPNPSLVRTIAELEQKLKDAKKREQRLKQRLKNAEEREEELEQKLQRVEKRFARRGRNIERYKRLVRRIRMMCRRPCQVEM